jgi:hypothetical protein
MERLLLVNEMPAAILLPASFVALIAEGLLFAVADRLDPTGIYPSRDQSAFHGTRTLIPQCEVVVG